MDNSLVEPVDMIDHKEGLPEGFNQSCITIVKEVNGYRFHLLIWDCYFKKYRVADRGKHYFKTKSALEQLIASNEAKQYYVDIETIRKYL
jgi:hypothetical protein